MPGTLFVVATPIGNLEDLSFRALRTLREVDLIAAEDTRRTAKLLARYEVRKSLVSLREHNEVRETPRLLERLRAGESIALVTDAGTPGISDPGARLVAAARQAGLPVTAIPGPSAITAALSSVGAPASHFVFAGFPPSSGKARNLWFDSVSHQLDTTVFFESPHRIRRTVSELISKGISPIYLLRELTKIHEQLVICTNTGDVEDLPESGEYCGVIPQRPEITRTFNEQAIISDLIGLAGDPEWRNPLLVEFLAWKHRAAVEKVRSAAKKAAFLAKQQSGPSA